MAHSMAHPMSLFPDGVPCAWPVNYGLSRGAVSTVDMPPASYLDQEALFFRADPSSPKRWAGLVAGARC